MSWLVLVVQSSCEKSCEIVELDTFLCRNRQSSWVLNHANLVDSWLSVDLHNASAKILLNIFYRIDVNSLVASWASHKKGLIFGDSNCVNRVFVFVKCRDEGSVRSKIGQIWTFDILRLFSMLI